MSEVAQERRWFQFSLQTLFVAILAIAIMLVVARLVPLQLTVFLAGTISERTGRIADDQPARTSGRFPNAQPRPSGVPIRLLCRDLQFI